MTALRLFVALLTLVLNAFFVGGEFALVSVRRSQIEPLAEEGDRRARTVLWALENISALMATAQLGITACTLVLGAVAEPALVHLLEPVFGAADVPVGTIHAVAFVLALAIATYLHMLVGEMVPKNIALADPARTTLALGPALVGLTRALKPLVLGVNALANAGLRLLRVELRDEVASAFSDAELARMVTDSQRAGMLDARATTRVREALELGRRPVGQVAIPAERVVSARLGITPDGLEHLAADSGFSRFPVTDDADRTLGYLHVKDALEAESADRPYDVAALRPITRVGAGLPLDDALTAMRARRAHLAEVVDSAGRPVGLVTMEDVLRELVGRPTGESPDPVG
ncbi:hemolysin family protein [Streptantibioticus silvisoli]|uniref:Hemolysin family protein n=1 Tax=Streptantibioticus silvisoli TaxID=2705255 RepID=A0ABT6VTP9_9ACTN|nr:hemolysin family protein [Streptantibioticus silvisoli]MDI5961857.1 hemolysin family protein [Streptantibioticus silvisoli]